MNQHQQDSSSDNPTDRRGAKIAFVGIGRMGSRLSRRLQDAGYTLTIYDKDPTQMLELAHRGAKVASTARAAADAADLVLSMVNDGRSLREVAGGGEGILRAETPPHVYIDMTTVDPESSAYVAELAESSCVSYLRAAVSGSTTLAETGDLTILVSGNASTFERHLPLLKLFG